MGKCLGCEARQEEIEWLHKVVNELQTLVAQSKGLLMPQEAVVIQPESLLTDKEISVVDEDLGVEI